VPWSRPVTSCASSWEAVNPAERPATEGSEERTVNSLIGAWVGATFCRIRRPGWVSVSVATDEGEAVR
jgi:hypothetical protein